VYTTGAPDRMHVIRVATQNIWGYHGDWPARRPALRDGLRDRDLVALQEAFDDQAAELLDGHEIAHRHEKGVAIASRWPIARTLELESDSLVAEIDAPLGRLVFANHAASYELTAERDREREAVELARLIEDLDPEHAILAGDFNATPESASVRFLLGLQSLDGMSVAYRDAGDVGHTFTPENPMMPVGEGGKWALDPGRRIDYVLVRCNDHGPTLEVRRCERLFDAPVDGVWASDHFGVGAVLALPPWTSPGRR
jgi:endonuclease/exonuclease/phosphatase family metal-dependent hydrolase